MLFKAADKFTREMLFEALESLREADRQLKTTSRNPRFVLERVILGICRKEIR
jgi:DNA polymerase III delta subunit